MDNRLAGDDTKLIDHRFREGTAVLLHDLTIENFRSFKNYKLNGLARVNLLVGDNNCGKTSVLEAVHLLVAQGAVGCVIENIQERNGIAVGPVSSLPDVLPLFRRQSSADVLPQDMITVSENNGKKRKLNVYLANQFDESTYELVLEAWESDQILRKEIIPSRSLARQQRSRPTTTPAPLLGPRLSGNRIPHIFVPFGGKTPTQLTALWNELLKIQREQQVLEAVNLIDPDVTKIQFASAARSRSQIWIDRGDLRLTAAELGAGTNSLISMSAALASSNKGVLLVDEIDTGLHYSRLADMWKMVITAAKNLDVQVFATTHSLDCIRGLAEAVRNDDTFVEDVAVLRIDRRTNEAIRFGGEELEVIVDHEIEVRG